MKFVIALFAPPHSPAARRALRFAEATLAGGHEISRLFFYQDGVHSASANIVAAQDELDVAAQWSRFVTANQLDGVVCIAAGLRRGVLDAGEAQRYRRPSANLAAGWELSGTASRSPRLLRRSLMARSLLIISRQAPWSGPSAREALDIVLAGGAFELPLGLLFLDDGVFQLAPAQLAASVEQKDLTANLQALPLFGIDALFAARRSLSERQLAESTLALPVEVLDDADLRALINRYDYVITL